MAESWTLKKINTKNIKTKASRLRAEAGKIAPTTLGSRAKKGGTEIIIISPVTAKNQITA
jgi:hypothetical protein